MASQENERGDLKPKKAAKRARIEVEEEEEENRSKLTDSAKSRNHANRTLISQESFVADGVRISLQTCTLAENRGRIDDKLNKIQNNPSMQRSLHVVRYILDCLTAKVLLNGRLSMLSFMPFAEAFDIYRSYYHDENICTGDKEQRKHLRNLLLHPEFGLCVYLLRRPNREELIILRPDNIDFQHLLSFIVEDEEKQESDADTDINKKFCQNLISAMDTEWDKRVLRVFIAAGRTNPEFCSLGFDSDLRSTDRKKVDTFVESSEDLQAEAKNLVIEDLKKKAAKLEANMKRKSSLLLEKKYKWTDLQISERQEEISSMKETVCSTTSLLDQVMEGVKSKTFTGMVLRKKRGLIIIKRLKMRSLGSGRKRLIDEEDERYIVKCIASKATAHGRRKDSVLYLGHRVKKKDLVALINRYHVERNLPMIKSATSIYNRSRPKNIRSLQARRHNGKALFCCKKSPKSEDTSTILTHFCRSTKKNVSLKLCNDDKDSVLFRSFDDKAYLCPGTSTGMQSTRSQKVITTVDEELARKFRKYDFPDSSLSCTPGVFLYMTKSVLTDENGAETLHIDSQDIVVAVKSKYFVGSSGSVWGSHSMENRHSHAVLHEMPNDISIDTVPIEIRNVLCKIRDYTNSFLIQNIKEDTLNVAVGENDFRTYERRKVASIHEVFDEGLGVLINFEATTECIDLSKLGAILTEGIAILEEALEMVEDTNLRGEMLIKYLEKVTNICQQVITEIQTFTLPVLRPRVADLVDAGPGVGINNHEVFYRAAQEIMVCKYDYYVRMHLAPGDSSQNEVERIQSSVGDAIADGGYIKWEHRKKFHDLTDEEVLAMSPEDLLAHEEKRMSHNAFKVCDEIAARIDGNIAPNGYMKAYPSKKAKHLFFWDTDYLRRYINEKTESVPGFHFYRKLKTLMETHTRIGEKYMEFIKCSNVSADTCSYCSHNPWIGMPLERIPEPIPDYAHIQKFKYKHYMDTESKINGVPREVNDFNPRVQLKTWFEEKKISLDKQNQVDKFSEKFIVDRNIVIDELTHLHNLNLGKVVRSKSVKKKRDEENKKTYEDFDWSILIKDQKLHKLKVDSLNKYLLKHDLNELEKLKKPQKIEAITSHYHAAKFQRPGNSGNGSADSDDDSDDDTDNDDTDNDDSDDDGDDGDDEVLVMLPNNENEELLESDSEDGWEDPSWFTTTRSGRVSGNPNLSTYRARIGR